MVRHDLTKLHMLYFDRHQGLPFLEFLEQQKSYSANDLRKAKLELVSKTKMLDLAIAEHKSLHNTEEAPAELEAARTSVYKELEEKQAACGPFVEYLDKLVEKDDGSEDDAEKMLQVRNLGIDVTDAHVEALYPYAKFNYDCGRYQLAALALKFYRQLIKDDEKKFSALWGKLAAEMLFANFPAAQADLRELRDEISRREVRKTTSHLDLLQQRTWLIHWSLAIFCKCDPVDGPGLLIEYLFNEFYVIQTNCPHILRYLVAMVIINKSRKAPLKDTIKLLSTEEKYSDPVTKFLLCICRDYDFELTQSLLTECVEVVANDYFLSDYLEQFLEGARLLVFEYYCRIHKCIEIETLGNVLYGEEKRADEDTENRIVDLIRTVGLNAHVDSEQRQINMVHKHQAKQNVYNQVIERLRGKNIDHRTRALIQQIDKKSD